MLYTVDVRHVGSELAEPMAEMRRWLDHRRIQPAFFGHSLGGPGIAFRITFTGENEAVAFAEAFRGRLENADPYGEPLWELAARPRR